MKDKPDFFLSAAGEMRGDLGLPRACWVKHRLKDQVRDDHLLIEVDPPVIGQKYCLGNEDITELIISARLQGFSLSPVSHWPCPVYISRILDETIEKTLVFIKDQIEIIGWGMIFRTLEEAIAHANQFHEGASIERA